MKAISLISIMLLATSVFAETPVSGTVSGTWTKEGSPYHVTGNLTVAKASELWVNPGVDVVFEGPYSLTVEGALVAGKEKGIHLRMKDNPPVKFTTDLEKNSAGWAGIKFVNARDDNALVNCTVEHVRTTGDGGGIRSDHSEISLTNCMLSDCSTDGAGGGVAMLGGEVSLTNCTIENCRAGGQGGAIYGANAQMTLTNCTIRNNTGSAGGALYLTKSELVSTNDTYEGNSVGGISLVAKSEGVITNSTLTGSGIACNQSQLVATNIHIESGDETALSCLEHSEAVITNAALKGKKGLDKDESSQVVATNVEE